MTPPEQQSVHALLWSLVMRVTSTIIVRVLGPKAGEAHHS